MPNFKLKQKSEQVQKAIDNALYPDKELTKEGVPADSKSVGIEIKKNSIHIGTEAPTNGETVWIDTDEEPEEENDGTQIDVIAQPGQIIAVKEVDANGKPTKWEAIDLPKVKEPETPDFSANEGDAGYIKNRTHYVDEKGVIHKLPNMYIDAEWMATKEDGGAGKTVFIPEQSVADGMWTNLQVTLTVGVVYAVEVNGILYRCECHSYDGTLYLGNGTLLGGTEHNGEPFCIAWIGGTATGGMFYNDDALETPIGIRVCNWLDEIYNTLPEEFLPGDIVRGEGGKVSWNELNDRPIGKDVGELLFSKTHTFSTDVAATSGTRLTGVSLSLTVGAEYWLEVNGDMKKCRFENVGSMEWELLDSDDNRWLRKAVTTWYLYGKAAGETTYNLYGLAENVVFDPKYIPSNIARKSDIPKGGGTGGTSIDVTAEVGQTIVVKEIDTNGKPTKWESADYQPRTHWTEEAVILPETTIEIDPDAGMGLVPDFTADGGKTYTITYNGVEYACKNTAEGSGMSMGNAGAVIEGAPVTDDPFALMYGILGEDEEGNGIFGWVIVPLDGSAKVTIAITETVIHILPTEYAPKPCIVDIDASSVTSSGTVKINGFDTTDMVNAILSDQPIYVNFGTIDNTIANDMGFNERLIAVVYGMYQQGEKISVKERLKLYLDSGAFSAENVAINLSLYSHIHEKRYKVLINSDLGD